MLLPNPTSSHQHGVASVVFDKRTDIASDIDVTFQPRQGPPRPGACEVDREDELIADFP